MTKKSRTMRKPKSQLPAVAKLDDAAEMAAEGGSLLQRIRRFTIRFLKRGYPKVGPKTPLSVFKDGRTLDVLAGAFADEVQYGNLFSGLIDAAKLKLPQEEYFPIIEEKGATVSSIIQYFLKKAEEAAPQ
jgi:hypothetical protein